jgi:potassium inwardly-rectifying channel subfamily J
MEPHHEAHSHSRRIVSKKGIVHTERSQISKRKRRYLSDFFNTMLDIKWRFVLLIFTLSFFLSWFGFAVLWWIIMFLRSDFEPNHLPPNQTDNNYIPCVLAIHNFASVFLFSVETQHTIGYGSRQTTERCPEAIFLQSLQSVAGVMIQACMVGTIFAKLSRPKKRTQTQGM